MAYIGKSPSNGVRSRFVYQASAGQTSFSGSDANSLTLAYTDSLYMDVYQNGVLLKAGTDYTATTGTSVVLVQAASLNDVVEMIVYDAFTVADSYTKTEADTRYPFLKVVVIQQQLYKGCVKCGLALLEFPQLQ